MEMRSLETVLLLLQRAGVTRVSASLLELWAAEEYGGVLVSTLGGLCTKAWRAETASSSTCGPLVHGLLACGWRGGQRWSRPRVESRKPRKERKRERNVDPATTLSLTRELRVNVNSLPLPRAYVRYVLIAGCVAVSSHFRCSPHFGCNLQLALGLVTSRWTSPCLGLQYLSHLKDLWLWRQRSKRGRAVYQHFLRHA
jgi:hypothetical protein